MMKWLLFISCLVRVVFSADRDLTILSSVSTSGANPLHGFKTFSVNSIVHSNGLQKKINQLIDQELGKIGKVERLEISSKNLDLTMENMAIGASSEGRLVVCVDPIFTLGDKELPVIQTSLVLNTSSTITKTKVDSLVNAWSANAFIEGALSCENSNSLLISVKAVLQKFISDYQNANVEKKEGPIFYLFTDASD